MEYNMQALRVYRPLAFLILVITFVLSQGSTEGAWAWTARVKSVHDGDTITVYARSGSKKTTQIRLYGVDAPELKQAYGRQAQQRLYELVSRQSVDIETEDTDHYGRTVALVRLKDGTLVNAQLVAEGCAWVYEQYCHQELCRELSALQQRARAEGLGLWAQDHPQNPAQWRRENKDAAKYKAPLHVVQSFVRKLGRMLP